jgi:hypothetical protein
MSRKGRLLKHQELGEGNGHSGEGSPYWNHVERFNRRTKEGLSVENRFANPDTLAYDSANTIWGTGSKPELAELIIERFAAEDGTFPMLSKMENKVLKLFVHTGDINLVIKELKISRSSCNTYLARIRGKFKRLLPALNF